MFLPQLLRYPNPTDPLNGEAAALLLKDPSAYEKKVNEYVKKFAHPEQFEDNISTEISSFTEEDFGLDAELDL